MNSASAASGIVLLSSILQPPVDYDVHWTPLGVDTRGRSPPQASQLLLKSRELCDASESLELLRTKARLFYHRTSRFLKVVAIPNKYDRNNLQSIHRSNISKAITFLLLIVVSLQHTGFPLAISYTVILIFYLFIGCIFVISKKKMVLTKTYTLLIILFSVILFTRTLSNPNVQGLAQLVAILSITVMNIFILPQIIELEDLFFVTTRFTSVAVIIGFLPYLGISFDFWYINLSVWGTEVQFFPQFVTISSLFTNPNTLGFLTMAGAASSFLEILKKRKKTLHIYLFINVAGLVFTNHTTGLVAFAVAFSITIIYILSGRMGVIIVTTGGILGILVGVFMLFAIIPAPSALTELSLSNRRALWKASVEAIKERPIFGHGLGLSREAIQIHLPPNITVGTHNSYLRMFVEAGAIGGFVYLSIYVGILVNSAKQAVGLNRAFLTALLAAFGIIQMFGSLSFLGVSLISTFIAITMGYHISGEK